MARSLRPALLLPFCVLGLSWLRSAPQEPAIASFKITDEVEAPEPERVRSEDVWLHPTRFMGRTIAFDVQIHSELASWNPMLTRFGSGEFRGFRCWSDEQFPWDQLDFRYPRVRVFARLGSAAEWALEGSERYARFELICDVRSNHAGQPWVEVVAVKPRLRRLGEGGIIHASRGLESMAIKNWAAAIDEFERANVGGIPPRAKDELERLIDECREKQKRILTPIDESR